jgi:putrescine aminotransferase
MEMERLISLEEALVYDRKRTRERYREYVNPGLVSMMALLDFDKRFTRAEGVKVWDSEGKEYLDFLGGYGALNFGHNPPVVVEALRRIGGVPNILQASLNPLAAALAENLATVTPGDLSISFFCNSGTEAVEAALKMARLYSGRSRILFCRNSFHGKSFGSLSVTGRDKYKKPFSPTLPDCSGVEYDNLDALEKHLAGEDVAAVIVEPIQGEGGIMVPRTGYLKGVRQLCDKYGVLLIMDEIQTGMGRTGEYFACQHEGVVPDIMCLAKSLGGGMMPVGACIALSKVYKKAYGSMDKCLLHTSTFGGNSMAMAAGIASVEYMVKNRLDKKAAQLGEYALERLRGMKGKYPLIKDVRGRGLMIGIEFHSGEGSLLDRVSGGAASKLGREYMGALVAGELLNRYRIITAYTLNNPNVIRLEPPLVIEREQMDYMLDSLERTLSENKGALSMMVSSVKSSLVGKVKKK